MSRPIKKALTFRASSIGDCLMGKYLLDNVRAQYPHARCGIVVGTRGAMIRDLLAAYPWIEVIEANRCSPAALWRLWREWRGSDLVVVQYAGKPGGRFSLASKCMARFLARRGGIVGFSDVSSFTRLLYDSVVPFDPAEAPAQMEREALGAAGVRVSIPYPVLAAVPAPEALKRFSLVPGTYILVHLFSGSAKRALSLERRRELVRTLVQEGPPDARILLTGTAKEREEALAAAAGTRAEVIAEKTTLQEMQALIGASRSVVAVDTGVAHMAAQLNRPLSVFTSCLGAQWWTERQYGAPESIHVHTNRAACGEHHSMVDYPPCLNAVSYDHTFLHL